MNSHKQMVDGYNFVTLPDGAVVSRPPGSRLDIVTTPDGNTSGVCQIVSLSSLHWPFHDGPDIPIFEAYFTALADYLAVKHLNEGDGSLVKELEGLNENCNIQFGLEYIDTKFDPQVAGNHILSRIGSVNEATNPEEGELYKFNPCVFLESTSYGHAQHATSFLTGLQGYTEISGTVQDHELNNKQIHPKFARTIADNSGIGEALVEFVRKVLKTNYMAILYLDEPSSINVAREIRAVAYIGDTEEEFHIEEVVLEQTFSNFKEVVSDLKKLRFNTIIAIIPELYPYTGTKLLMEEAWKQGIAGKGDVTWIFDIGSRGALLEPVEKGSVLHEAYRGSGLLINSDFRGPNHDKFFEVLNEFKNKDDEFQQFLSMLPGSDGLNVTADEYFEYYEQITSWVRYKYDATVLSGLAACRAVNNSLFLDGDEFYNQVVRTEFQGTTGSVKLDETTGSRLTNSTVSTMINIPDLNETNKDGDGKYYFQFNPVGKFVSGEWEESGEFIFNNGSPQPPREIPLIYDNDEFVQGTVTLVVASLLCAIPIILALGCAIWTRLNEKKRIVRASQPFFLYFISAGTIVFALSIVPQMFDLTRASKEGMEIACNAGIWLFLIGISIVLSAFFAKTHRIVQIMKASERCKRVTITIKDAVVPMAIVLTCNIILLSVSTALNPFEYEAAPFGAPDRFGRTTLAYGQCDFTGHTIFFTLAGILNLGLLCLCAYEAFQARTLATEFQETEHILKALLITGGVLFIGLPIYALNRNNADVRLYITSVITFAMCNIVLFVMFAPKMLYKAKDEPPQNIRVYVQGATDNTSSTSDGERILTSKTRGELVVEIAELRKRLAASTREA